LAFTIPNNDEAYNPNQSIWMQTDIDALVAGHRGEGVISGCDVTAQGVPNMTVAVASGKVRVSQTIVPVTAGNVTISAANPTNPRIDLVVVNNAGTKSAVTGTAAANPKAPALPANSVLLAMVYVPASATSIPSNLITDKRVIVYDDDVVMAIIIDGAGNPITTGVKADVEAAFDFTITGWTLVADQTGSIVIDVWKNVYANFPPTSANSITGSEKPTLSSQQKNQNLTISSWNKSVTKGDWFRFNVDSVSTVQRVTLSIRGTKLK
jgi:hypothetical protein